MNERTLITHKQASVILQQQLNSFITHAKENTNLDLTRRYQAALCWSRSLLTMKQRRLSFKKKKRTMKLPKVTHLAQFSFMLPLCEIRETPRCYAVLGCRPLILPVCSGAGATTSQPGIPGAPGPRGVPGNSGYTGDRGRRLSVSVYLKTQTCPQTHHVANLSYRFVPLLSRVRSVPQVIPGTAPASAEVLRGQPGR